MRRVLVQMHLVVISPLDGETRFTQRVSHSACAVASLFPARSNIRRRRETVGYQLQTVTSDLRRAALEGRDHATTWHHFPEACHHIVLFPMIVTISPDFCISLPPVLPDFVHRGRL